jgi:hypothetical protein
VFKVGAVLRAQLLIAGVVIAIVLSREIFRVESAASTTMKPASC